MECDRLPVRTQLGPMGQYHHNTLGQQIPNQRKKIKQEEKGFTHLGKQDIILGALQHPIKPG